MSKYTTEVRYICESYAGLEESVGYDSIDEVIEKSYLKIFNNSKIPMFKGEDEAHRALLLKKILLHYYSREIDYETVGLWKLKLNQKMIEIMPYYNQLYESELLKFDPLQNIDVTHTHEGEYNDDEKVDNLRNTEDHKATHTEQVSDATENVTLRHSKTTTQGNDVRTNDIVSNGEAWTLFSDTPQGGINGIANASSGSVSDNSYLTNATHQITTPDEQSVTQTHGNIVETYNADGDKMDTTVGHAEVDTQTTENANGKITDDNTKNTQGTDEYTNKDIGKIGTETYSEMLNKFRDTFLNIDLMVIRELEPLFMGLW
jgi:hypothetical protein